VAWLLLKVFLAQVDFMIDYCELNIDKDKFSDIDIFSNMVFIHKTLFEENIPSGTTFHRQLSPGLIESRTKFLTSLKGTGWNFTC